MRRAVGLYWQYFHDTFVKNGLVFARCPEALDGAANGSGEPCDEVLWPIVGTEQMLLNNIGRMVALTALCDQAIPFEVSSMTLNALSMVHLDDLNEPVLSHPTDLKQRGKTLYEIFLKIQKLVTNPTIIGELEGAATSRAIYLHNVRVWNAVQTADMTEEERAAHEHVLATVESEYAERLALVNLYNTEVAPHLPEDFVLLSATWPEYERAFLK